MTLEEVADPAMWLKAQPNLGQTVTYETYQLDVERAEKAPAARNDILAKRFGIPMEGYTYFFTYEETLPASRSRVLADALRHGRGPFAG
jgi:phage terminase large subunit-like protein